MKLVRAAFGHDVEKAGVGASDFRAGASAHHLKLTNSRLGEKEHGFIAAALIPLKRVVEVSAIHGDIGVD